MYSDRPYSLLRYSVNPAAREAPISVSFLEGMNAVIGAAVPVPTSERFAEAFQGAARGTVAVVSGLSVFSGLLADVTLSANVAAAASMAETLGASAAGSKDVPALLLDVSKLDTLIWGSKNIPFAGVLADALEAAAAGSKNILLEQLLSDALAAVTAATTQTTQTASFQLTIPPGGELRIDSGVFTVTLDGVNALHTQSGDWIEVSRELLRLLVESASGGQLEGQLVYTERYL